MKGNLGVIITLHSSQVGEGAHLEPGAPCHASTVSGPSRMVAGELRTIILAPEKGSWRETAEFAE